VKRLISKTGGAFSESASAFKDKSKLLLFYLQAERSGEGIQKWRLWSMPVNAAGADNGIDFGGRGRDPK